MKLGEGLGLLGLGLGGAGLFGAGPLGGALGGIGKGTWDIPENEHTWKFVMHVDLSNGDKQSAEGEIDLETLMYEGKIYSVD